MHRLYSSKHLSNGENRSELPNMGRLQHEGRQWPITPSNQLRTRIDICGEVTGLLSPQSDDEGNIQIKFNLQQGVDRVEVKNCYFPKPKRITRRMQMGRIYALRVADPQNGT